MSKKMTILLAAISGAGFGFGIGFSVVWVFSASVSHTFAFRHTNKAALWAGIGVAIVGFIAGIMWTAEVTDSVPRHVPRSRID